MEEYVAELTRKTNEIKSSDGEQLGAISDIVNNRILMNVAVGRRGKFVVPEKMIDNIRKGVAYLTLTKKMFEKWWATKGVKFKREYETDPDIALGRRVVGKDLQLLRNNIGKACESVFGLKISKKEREKICSEQEDLRISLPAHLRDELALDEWVYSSLKLSLLEEDVFLITSKKLIRLMSGRGRWHNWVIPIDKIESVSVMSMDRYEREFGAPWRMRGRGRYAFSHALHIRYRIDEQIEYENVWMHAKEFDNRRLKIEQLKSVKELIEEVMRGKGGVSSVS